MDYYEGLIKDTEFFTTSELADKLKMNVQVITRKVQSGEIYAYKIGKDCRIPEQAVFNWLQERSNQGSAIKSNKPKKKTVKKEAVLETNENVDGKDKFVLEYILAQFEPDRLYDEKEVNGIITRHNADSKIVVQELVTEKMMEIIDGKYKRRSEYRLS